MSFSPIAAQRREFRRSGDGAGSSKRGQLEKVRALLSPHEQTNGHMAYIDFLSAVHKSTQRDYLARVNDPEYPEGQGRRARQAVGLRLLGRRPPHRLRRLSLHDGRWAKVARPWSSTTACKAGDKVLDVGCGKGFLLYDFTQVVPGMEVTGIDISEYAIAQCQGGSARQRFRSATPTTLPFADEQLRPRDLDQHAAQPVLLRAGRGTARDRARRHGSKYICVESYRNEAEKANLLYWQVTCETFYTPAEWEWWFRQTGYTGDHSFIYFE